MTVRRAGATAFDEPGQALVLFVACLFLLALGGGILGAFGKALLTRQRQQTATDLAAVSAARSMRDDFTRLFEPSLRPGGRSNPAHLEKVDYLARARRTAIAIARDNGARSGPVKVTFPDERSFAPVRVRVRVSGRFDVALPGAGSRRAVAADAVAEAELVPPDGEAGSSPDGNAVTGPRRASGGGYSGPLAYRQGKPMRPDVALAFDRLERAARAEGVALVITSGYRSDAEQARLFAQHPDPRWVAPPGKSLHRLGTELDLGPPTAYGWLATNAGRFGFLRRYS